MTKHTNKSGDISNNLTFKWTPLASILAVVIVFVLLLPFIPHMILSSYGARRRTNYHACIQQLMNVGSGLLQHISEKGSLHEIRSEDDVCHYILPGYDNPRECIGKVKEQISDICLQDSYSIKILDGQRYEIRAKSNEKSQCDICVTESAARPKMYDPTGECKKFSCVHTNE